jgi:hypothetical protein
MSIQHACDKEVPRKGDSDGSRQEKPSALCENMMSKASLQRTWGHVRKGSQFSCTMPLSTLKSKKFLCHPAIQEEIRLLSVFSLDFRVSFKYSYGLKSK